MGLDGLDGLDFLDSLEGTGCEWIDSLDLWVQAKKADEVATKDSMQRASVEREKAWVLVG